MSRAVAITTTHTTTSVAKTPVSSQNHHGISVRSTLQLRGVLESILASGASV